MAGILQITDGLSTTVLVDLNGGTGGVGGYARTQPNLGTGQLAEQEAAVRWSPSGGPATMGRRQAEIPWTIVGSSADDLAARVANLSAATRQPWWLRIRRHGATADSWLQCYPARPVIDTGRVTASVAAHIASGTISCETEPYALGARVDVAQATIGQDPAVAGAFVMDINGVEGDTETPLLLRLNDGTAFGTAQTTFISVRRRGTPANLTAAALTVQAEAGTSSGGTNVTVAALSDAALSGGSGMRATFAAGYVAGVSAQVNFPAPSLSGPDVPGLYRVFARVRRPTGAGTVVLKPFLTAAALTPDDINSEQTLAAEATQVIDLGLVQWPAGMPATLHSPLAHGATATGTVLQFWRLNAGATTVDFDWMAWIPADEDAGYLQTNAAIPSAASRWVVLDGPQMMAAVMDADPIGGAAKIVGQGWVGNTSNPKLTFAGGPHVRKGDNRLFVVTGLSLATSLAKTNTIKVSASYWPRYTWLR